MDREQEIQQFQTEFTNLYGRTNDELASMLRTRGLFVPNPVGYSYQKVQGWMLDSLSSDISKRRCEAGILQVWIENGCSSCPVICYREMTGVQLLEKYCHVITICKPDITKIYGLARIKLNSNGSRFHSRFSKVFVSNNDEEVLDLTKSLEELGLANDVSLQLIWK